MENDEKSTLLDKIKYLEVKLAEEKLISHHRLLLITDMLPYNIKVSGHIGK